MNKLLTKIVGLTLGLSMAVGVGVAVAATKSNPAIEANATESIVYTLNGSTAGKGNSYAGTGTATVGSIVWAIEGNAEQTPWRLGIPKKTTETDKDRSVYSKSALTAASSEDFTKAVLTLGTKSGSLTINSIGIKVGTTEGGSEVSSEIVTTDVNVSNATVTFSRPNGKSWANRYFSFAVNMSGSGSSSSAIYVQFSKVEFYADVSTTYTVTYDANGGSGSMSPSTGASITLPSCSFTAPTNKVFKEWNTAADGLGTSYAPGASVSQDLDLFAIWYDPYAFSGDTLTFANQNLVDSTAYTARAFTSGVFTAQFGGGGNNGKYYNTGDIRFYTNGTLVLTPVNGKITEVSFTWGSGKPASGTYTLSSGEFDANYEVWTGNTDELTLTCNLGSGSHWRLETIQVTVSASMEVVDVEYEPSSTFDVVKTQDIVLYGHEVGASQYTVLSGLSWDIDDESIATIVGATDYCTVTGVGIGSTTLTMSKTGYADVEVTIHVTGGSVVAIGITGAMSGTFSDGQAWDPTGLTVTALYESSDEEDVTSSVTWTYYVNDVLSTHAAYGDTSVKAHAEYEGESAEYSRSIVVTRANTFNIVDGGRYKIYHTFNETKYYLVENGTSSAPGITTNTWEATVFTFNLVGNDTFTFTNSTNHLYCTNGNNGLRYGTNDNYEWEFTAGTHWNGTAVVNSGEGHYNIMNTAYSRYISLYLGNDSENPVATDFRSYLFNKGGTPATYNEARQSSTQLEYFDADQYATDFTTYYAAGCDYAGSYTPANMHWDIAEDQFDLLAASEQAKLVGAEYTKSGSGSGTIITPASGVSQAVANAVARYDYVVVKYTTSVFGDFMERSPSGLSNPNVALNMLNNTDNAVTIIAIISVISVSAIGGFFFLRKRKEQ